MERALPQNQYRHKEQGDRDKESDRCGDKESLKNKTKKKTGKENGGMKKRKKERMQRREKEMDAGEKAAMRWHLTPRGLSPPAGLTG